MVIALAWGSLPPGRSKFRRLVVYTNGNGQAATACFRVISTNRQLNMVTGPAGKGRDCKSQASQDSEFDSHRNFQVLASEQGLDRLS